MKRVAPPKESPLRLKQSADDHRNGIGSCSPQRIAPAIETGNLAAARTTSNRVAPPKESPLRLKHLLPRFRGIVCPSCSPKRIAPAIETSVKYHTPVKPVAGRVAPPKESPLRLKLPQRVGPVDQWPNGCSPQRIAPAIETSHLPIPG